MSQFRILANPSAVTSVSAIKDLLGDNFLGAGIQPGLGVVIVDSKEISSEERDSFTAGVEALGFVVKEV